MHPHASTIKRLFYTLALLSVAVFAWFTVAARAQSAPVLSFQGKVTAVDGTELADGVYDIDFVLYNQPTGGAPLWGESLMAANLFSGTIASVTDIGNGLRYDLTGLSGTTTLRVGQYLSASGSASLIIDYDGGTGTVTVASGSPLFAVGASVTNRPWIEGGIIDLPLGTVAELTGVDFSQTLYLQVTFAGEIMQPRKLMTSVARAFSADTFGGYSAGEIAVLAENETVSGEWSFNNAVSVATSSATAALSVVQNGSGDLFEVKRGAVTAFAVLNDGRVRIGGYYLPATDGSAGYVLKTDGSGNVTWALDINGGFGPSGADMVWATSSDELSIHPYDTSLAVVVGDNATTSNVMFEVRGDAFIDGILSADSLVLGAPLALSYGGLGVNLNAATGFVYVSGGTAVASATLDISLSNLSALAPLDLNGHLLSIDTAGDWSGTLDGIDGAEVYTLSAWFSTTTAGQLVSLPNLSSVGTITNGVWQGSVIGLAYGGTGAATAPGARRNLGLEEIYAFGITSTGTANWLWASDGDGRGHWVATGTLGMAAGSAISQFVGTTTALSDGSFSSSGLVGYAAANDLCDTEYPGSHFCRSYDIIASIELQDIGGWGNDLTSAWMAEGPPGYQANSNDCRGWMNGTTDYLGAYWKFNSVGGGAGWLIHCGNVLPLTCCIRQ